jgi:hypothetical protein
VPRATAIAGENSSENERGVTVIVIHGLTWTLKSIFKDIAKI